MSAGRFFTIAAIAGLLGTAIGEGASAQAPADKPPAKQAGPAKAAKPSSTKPARKPVKSAKPAAKKPAPKATAKAAPKPSPTKGKPAPRAIAKPAPQAPETAPVAPPHPAVAPAVTEKPPVSRLSPKEAESRFQVASILEQNGDLRESFKAYTEAAEAGHPLAQKKLGDLYGTGNDVVERDYETSLRWYQKAREQGVPIPKPFTYPAVRR